MPNTSKSGFERLEELRSNYLLDFNRLILQRQPFENPKTREKHVRNGWPPEVDPIAGADVGNLKSLFIMERWASLLPGTGRTTGSSAAQASGTHYEDLLVQYINDALGIIAEHVPAASGLVAKRLGKVTNFDQYCHLVEMMLRLRDDADLESVFGREYTIKPDIVVYRERYEANAFGERRRRVAEYTPFFKDAKFARNQASSKRTRRKEAPILEAIVSCKFSIRSDRVQNVRTESISAVRMRKGKLPRIMAAAAEPLCSRLESIALGTGDVDCVYHTALPELLEATESVDEKQFKRLQLLVQSRRLRDVSDMPFDLIV